MASWRKAIGGILRRVGMHSYVVALLRWRAHMPLFLVNFMFQRILGINRDCPWSVHYTSKVVAPKKLHVPPSSRLSFAVSGNCYIQALNGVEIGDDTIFAPGVRIISADHSELDFHDYVRDKPIRIGRRCWIGANAVVLPGVELGDRVIVGAGTVVTKSFPGGCVIAGVPASVIRQVRIEIAPPDGELLGHDRDEPAERDRC